jgi:hypothetical protein
VSTTLHFWTGVPGGPTPLTTLGRPVIARQCEGENPMALSFYEQQRLSQHLNKFMPVNLRLPDSNRPGGMFLLAALVSTGSRQDTSTPEERMQWGEVTHKLESSPLGDNVNSKAKQHSNGSVMCPSYMWYAMFCKGLCSPKCNVAASGHGTPRICLCPVHVEMRRVRPRPGSPTPKLIGTPVSPKRAHPPDGSGSLVYQVAVRVVADLGSCEALV